MVCGEIEQRRRRTLSGLAPGRQRTHLNTSSPLPTTDAKQDQLLADFATAALTRERAVTGGTRDDKS